MKTLIGLTNLIAFTINYHYMVPINKESMVVTQLNICHIATK